MRKKAWLIGLTMVGLVIACGGLWHAAQPAAAAEQVAAAPRTEAPEPPDAAPAYADRGAESCMRCHDSGSPLAVLKTPHAMKGDSRTPFGQHFCESCHGASPDHISKPPKPGERRTPPAVVFKGDRISPPAERAKICLGCHENGLRMNWRGSQHSANDIACNDCHTIHAPKDPLLIKESQPQVCFKCHTEQRAQSAQFSHHPIREGKVVCSDCHNPHGSPGPKLLKEVRVNDTCYACHAEKRGPLLWEHQPVREDCTNCHNPHGSTNMRLLKERLPYLCTSCHSVGGAMGDSYGHQATPALAGNRGAAVQMNSRSCLNCHSNIHGSNSPSGAFFHR